MATNPLVPRRARVTVNVTRPNSQGEQEDLSYSFMNHRMRIMVRQADKQFGNAKVEVFGVPLDTMNQIARLWLESLTPQNTDKLLIDVFDGEGFVPFFQGVIMWSAVDASAVPQVKLVIEANSSMALMNLAASPYANPEPVLLSDALTQIIKPAGFTLDYSPSAPVYMVSDRVNGSPLEQVDKLIKGFPDLTWHTSLQRLVVRKINTPFTADPLRIAPDTGLQGFPVYSTSGLQFSTVFNPQLIPGVAVDVITPFDLVTRTKWVTSVLSHTLDVNVPGGHWSTAAAATSYGQKGNAQN